MDRDSITEFIMKLISIKNATVEFLLDPEKFTEQYNHKQIQRGLQYLKQKKFVAFPARSPKARILLTKLGLRRLNQIKFQKNRIKRSAWDGQWRLLTFDIPEKQSGIRQTFRRKLKELGFFHFQRSVFVFPFECEREINLITDYLHIAACVHLLVANRFRGDKQLLKKFNV